MSEKDEKLSLLAQLREDWAANGKDWTKPGFQALAVHRFGNWRMRVAPKIVRAPLSAAYRTMFRGVRNFYGIELPYSAKVGRRVVIEHQGGIVVHGDAEIGDDCVIRQGVTIGNKRMDQPFDAPKIGRGVNIGAGAVVLGAITVGDGATVGANSVVVKDVAEATAVAGNPAKVIKGE